MIRYSRGASKYDAHPQIREVPDFDTFATKVLADRARSKGQQYICAPFKINGDGRAHRCADGVEPRRFIALDVDRMHDGETYAALRVWLMKFKGLGFTTASHKPDAPRCRVIIELDRDVDRTEGMRLGAAIMRDIEEEFGDTVKLDPSTHRGEQPCYGPVFTSETFTLDGEPLDVETWLADAPSIEPERKGSASIDPDDDPVIVKLKQRSMYLRDLGAGRHAIRCPWEADHTSVDDEQSTATIYFQPHHGGYKTAGFKCLHEHCAKRNGDDLLAFLGLDWNKAKDKSNPGAKKEETPPPAGITIADLLLKPMPEIKTLCAPWLLEGVLLLSAPPKAGKTTLMRQAAEAVAIGGKLLDSQCEASPAFFLSLEEGERMFRRKCQTMRIDPKAAERINVFFDWPQGALGAAALVEYLQAHPGTRLVIIDSLSKFRLQADRGVTLFQADYDAVTQLSSVAKQFPGLVVVIIHHTRKQRSADAMEDVSGTFGLTAACDQYMVLRKQGAGGLLSVGGRLWDRDDSEFELTRADQRWHLKGVSDGMSDSERYTLKCVSESGGVTPSVLAKMLNSTRQNAYQRLDALLAKGKVDKRNGVYVVL